MNKLNDRFRTITENKLVLLVAGFFLTGVIGTYLNQEFQSAAWQRDKRYELLRTRLDRGTEMIEELASLMNKRVFGLNRLDFNADASWAGFRPIWDQYYGSVIEWNESVNAFKHRVTMYVGEDEALDLLDYRDESHPASPRSIHGHFVKAHSAMFALRQCIRDGCADQSDLATEAHNTLGWLESNTDRYIERITAKFVKGHSRLDSLAF